MPTNLVKKETFQFSSYSLTLVGGDIITLALHKTKIDLLYLGRLIKFLNFDQACR
jgi:hypothetical protein